MGLLNYLIDLKWETTFPDPVLAKDISTVTATARGVYVMSA